MAFHEAVTQFYRMEPSHYRADSIAFVFYKIPAWFAASALSTEFASLCSSPPPTAESTFPIQTLCAQLLVLAAFAAFM